MVQENLKYYQWELFFKKDNRDSKGFISLRGFFIENEAGKGVARNKHNHKGFDERNTFAFVFPQYAVTDFSWRKKIIKSSEKTI